MKAIVYTGINCSWCDRVKDLLETHHYEVESIPLDGHSVTILESKYNKIIKTVPQVIINDNLIGGYNEVETHLTQQAQPDQRMVSKWKKHEEYSKKTSRENLRPEPRHQYKSD
jgi:glutaredoxin